MIGIRIHEKDNVAVALKNLDEGEMFCTGSLNLLLREHIFQGHKFALENIRPGDDVVKYGFPIGRAKKEIRKGEWVHVHNLETKLDESESYQYNPVGTKAHIKPKHPMTFKGFERKDGSVGTRNELWIIPTVGCINSLAGQLKYKVLEYSMGKVDQIRVFAHPYGCSQMGDDHRMTQRALAALASHPNAGGVLVLGLGCENNRISEFKKVLGMYDPERIAFLECQGVSDEMGEGERILKRLLDHASRSVRVPVPVSELVVGLKCGGSDGLSGLTANPLVGRFSDDLISQGGTTLLTEVPEMFGAETILMDRCKDRSTFQDTVDLVNHFKTYFTDHGQVIYENPSPGNKEGGISTLEDKSLGCIQKGGMAPVTDVLDYAQKVKSRGLNLLLGPGNDIVSTSALVMSGAQIVLFTTGRGNPMGCAVPTLKISSNSGLSQFKCRWIDVNGGELAEGMSMEAAEEELFHKVVAVAGGEQTKSEREGLFEFAIFKNGVTL